MLPHQAGVVCLAVGRLLSLRFDERENFLRDLPRVVVELPGLYPGEGAVGELLQQPPHPLRLGPPQGQVILRFDQEKPGHLGDQRIQPRLMLGDGRLQRDQPLLEQVNQLVGRKDGAIAEGGLEPGVLPCPAR